VAVLEDKDLIQVDATVIAGILILLTLSSVAAEDPEFRLSYNIAVAAFFLASILPFSISAVYILKGSFSIGNPPANYLTKAGKFTLAGFIYILVVVAFIVVVSAFSSIHR
jgi:hypothetical protein